MKREIFFLIALFAVAACSNNGAKLTATINNANEKDIVISRLDVSNITPVDTVKTDKSGRFSYKVEFKDENPQFFYVDYNNRRLASLIIKPSDHITISTDTSAKNLTIQGSQDSKLLKSLDSTFNVALSNYEILLARLDEAVSNQKPQDEIDQIKHEIGRLYVKQKQNTLRSILSNPYSFSNVRALYQKFNENLPVFAEFTDGMLFNKVYDSLCTLYPNSVYVKLIKREADAFNNRIALQERFANVEAEAFPNINLPDINSKPQELRELLGRPFILYFWGAADVNQKIFNRELKDLYEKYNPKGLEIYQVSVDTDKTLWATAVKEQGLPWINVCDGKSGSSAAIRSYNINKVPVIFIFNSEGDIVARDIFDIKKLEATLDKICK